MPSTGRTVIQAGTGILFGTRTSTPWFITRRTLSFSACCVLSAFCGLTSLGAYVKKERLTVFPSFFLKSFVDTVKGLPSPSLRLSSRICPPSSSVSPVGVNPAAPKSFVSSRTSILAFSWVGSGSVATAVVTFCTVAGDIFCFFPFCGATTIPPSSVFSTNAPVVTPFVIICPGVKLSTMVCCCSGVRLSKSFRRSSSSASILALCSAFSFSSLVSTAFGAGCVSSSRAASSSATGSSTGVAGYEPCGVISSETCDVFTDSTLAVLASSSCLIESSSALSPSAPKVVVSRRSRREAISLSISSTGVLSVSIGAGGGGISDCFLAGRAAAVALAASTMFSSSTPLSRKSLISASAASAGMPASTTAFLVSFCFLA